MLGQTVGKLRRVHKGALFLQRTFRTFCAFRAGLAAFQIGDRIPGFFREPARCSRKQFLIRARMRAAAVRPEPGGMILAFGPLLDQQLGVKVPRPVECVDQDPPKDKYGKRAVKKPFLVGFHLTCASCFSVLLVYKNQLVFQLYLLLLVSVALVIFPQFYHIKGLLQPLFWSFRL